MFGIKKLKRDVDYLEKTVSSFEESQIDLKKEFKFELYKIKNPQQYNNGDVIEFNITNGCDEKELKEGVVCSHRYKDGHSREMFYGFNTYLSFSQPSSFYTVKDIKDFNNEYEVNANNITKLSNKKIKIK